MMQYRNGLIGKHFKMLMQTAVFHIHDIVSGNQFTLAKALGELGAALWIAEIDDLEQYLVQFLCFPHRISLLISISYTGGS